MSDVKDSQILWALVATFLGALCVIALLVGDWHASDNGARVGVERARACASAAPGRIDKCVHP